VFGSTEEVETRFGVMPRMHDRLAAAAELAARETRAQCRVKVGTDSGRPVFNDDRDHHVSN
jgi:hypothetical protein